MSKYLMSFDQGTTSSRAILFNLRGEPVSSAAYEFEQIFPHEGWVEHNPDEIWGSQLRAARKAMEKVGASAEDIAAIGITNQRETTIVWERSTGNPVCNAIVWQCRRTADFCDELKARGMEDMIRRKTGLVIDPYFSASKLRWILNHVPGARQKAEAGELMFGTVDTWLIYKLTDGRVHATDYSNASRTMLFNINTMDWDDELLTLFDIPRAMLPELCPSSHHFGNTDADLFGREIPIASAIGDQQAALFGQGCYTRGDAKNTYGTGGFLLMNTGESPVFSDTGLVTSVAWGLDGKVNYALEGSVFICGAAIQWLRDCLGILQNAAESETLAASVKNTGGVYFVPAFVGLGAPYWDPYARGAIFGITRGTTKAHITRATLEAMAFQTVDVLDVMQKEVGLSLSALRVDGGASANNILLSLQSDFLGVPVIRSACLETTALGAALLAGLATGCFASVKHIQDLIKEGKCYTPRMSAQNREQSLAGWHSAIKRTLGKL